MLFRKLEFEGLRPCSRTTLWFDLERGTSPKVKLAETISPSDMTSQTYQYPPTTQALRFTTVCLPLVFIPLTLAVAGVGLSVSSGRGLIAPLPV